MTSLAGPRPLVFAFFGYPGAGKSTLCRRFGELHSIPAIDTDAFMTAEERAAVETDRYTQAMRLANIDRYCARVRELSREHPAVALADGLPNAEARGHVRRGLPDASVIFVLVQTPPDLWRERLEARDANAVAVGVIEAEAYVRDHWEALPASFKPEVIENGPDRTATDNALLDLYHRHVGAAAR